MKTETNSSELEVAIVGMDCRFPGAGDIASFWQNLCQGKEAITFFTDQELRQAGYEPAVLQQPHLVKAASILPGIGLFDAPFFGYSPREAEQIDPQQRLFLECAWTALEDAGCDPSNFPGMVGVYAGTGINTYLINMLAAGRNKEGAHLAHMDGMQLTVGNDKDYLTTRLSYKLHLTGPSVCVQTACSTSLVAVHLACQGLLNYECDVAIAGGVSVRAPQPLAYVYQEGGILSPDAHCRAFDSRGRGTIFGNGLGVVILKRLEDALAGNDRIYAVIKGTAINNDGAAKVGFTAPSVDGQVGVIKKALAAADVSPNAISLIEAHGTATQLGDAVEMEALRQVFGPHKEPRTCAIGSVKTNLGHLDVAAGIAGLIKTVLCLYHKMIPPSLHFESPNPESHIEESPFYVNTTLRPWAAGSGPRRAGISSFGIGGTNAHAVLEEPPPSASGPAFRPWQLLTISARTETSLMEAEERLQSHLASEAALSLADVAFTLHVGRRPFAHRRAVVCGDQDDRGTLLTAPASDRVSRSSAAASPPAVVFMFPGQGAQHPGMAQEVYRAEPVFRREIDLCAEILHPLLDRDLKGLIWGAGDGAADRSDQDLLHQTQYTQPALFAIEYALARLWQDWGAQPHSMIGHSVGEYVAACLSGVMSLEVALRIVAVRGRLMQAQPPGGMLAVNLSESEVRSHLPDDISLASVNADRLCTVAGPLTALDNYKAELRREGVACHRLRASHAFHSALMEESLAPFAEEIGDLELQPPRIPFVSNVSGRWITPEEATTHRYWVNHLRATVRFSDGLRTICQQGPAALLEVGPSQTLTKLARQSPAEPGRVVVSSLPERESSAESEKCLLQALGQVWAAGCNINWENFHRHESRRKVSLPTYPFERQLFWFDGLASLPAANSLRPAQPERRPLKDWCVVPAWRQFQQIPLAQGREEARPGLLLVFASPGSFGEEVAEACRAEGWIAILVRPGSDYQELGPGAFEIDPARAVDYQSLLGAVLDRGQPLHAILHCWTLDEATTAPEEVAEGRFAQVMHYGYNSLLFLAQALGPRLTGPDVHLFVITSSLFAVTGHEPLDPMKALLLGPSQVIPQEYPGLECQVWDIEAPDAPSKRRRLASQLAAEVGQPSTERALAYRALRRWAQGFEPLILPERVGASPFRQRGVYLITGGLGGLGLGLAKELAQECQARLVFINRQGLPPQAEWQTWLIRRPAEDVTSQRIRQVLELESLGSEVLSLTADVADPSELAAAIAAVRERFGRIHGVFHLAGAPGGGLIQLKDSQSSRQVWRPKVQGTMALRAVLGAEELDFWLCFSSITSVTGGLGQVDYCAASAFLDSFAWAQAVDGELPVITVDWDAWRQDTWQETLNAVSPELRQAFKENREKFGIEMEEGMRLIRRLLAVRIPQVIVSRQDLQTAIQDHRRYAHAFLSQGFKRAARGATTSVELSDFVPPRTPTERLIAHIWSEVLGIEKIGAHDNFINLGGHSLLAVQLGARLRQEMRKDFPLRAIFDRPTVAAMADLLDSFQDEQEEYDDLARILTEIENLSDDEVRDQIPAPEYCAP